jgi:hypothetical protein
MEIRDSQMEMEQMLLFPEELISLSEERLANLSVPQEREKGLTEQADWQKHLLNYFMQCVPAGSSGKMCRGVCPQGISEPESMTSTFFSQRLQGGGIVARGEYLTVNMSEWTDSLVPFLKEEGVCSLSDILEMNGNIPQKYYLSRQACLGIIRRAALRGKDLPPMLKEALERQAAHGTAAE